MIHLLSRITAYIETYYFNPNGEESIKSHATGFFVKKDGELYLISNWHVFSGLNPSNPTELNTVPSAPHYLKIFIPSKTKNNFLTEFKLSLYNKNLAPVWLEHQLGCVIDIAAYELPIWLEDFFYFFPVNEIKSSNLQISVAKDVFILGYPFRKEEMKTGLGDFYGV